MRRVLFCNIAYLPYYDTKLDTVEPQNGGSYVLNEGDALEKHNFEICADGQCRGFVETKHRKCYSNLNHTSAAHTTPPVTGVLPLCTRLRRVRRNNPPWRSL